ncbi:MAG TPA: hypothetical protein VH619_19560 [Verrucomicrobiae bacterium]|nr:hypothetical protein [Verrucomicrobiae bacterium]
MPAQRVGGKTASQVAVSIGQCPLALIFLFTLDHHWQADGDDRNTNTNFMPEKPAPPKKLSEKSTKQEMLEAYQTLAKQLEEKRAAELAPERRLEEKRAEEAVKVAAAVESDSIDREIGGLKAQIGKMLAEISDRLATESTRFANIQKAVESKEQELKELYGIEKAAVSLAALIEAQNQKRIEFETNLASQREELQHEIDSKRTEWDEEKRSHEAEIKERDAVEKKTQDRAREDFNYGFKREQQALKDKLNDEKTALEKDIKLKRETAEKEFAEREKALGERERELAELRDKTASFPKELQTAVAEAVKEATDKLRLEAKSREDITAKQFEGERNVLAARNESLERANKDLLASNTKLAQQLEAAYQKVQDIAEKTVEGASQSKSLAELQKLLLDQNRRGREEKP